MINNDTTWLPTSRTGRESRMTQWEPVPDLVVGNDQAMNLMDVDKGALQVLGSKKVVKMIAQSVGEVVLEQAFSLLLDWLNILWQKNWCSWKLRAVELASKSCALEESCVRGLNVQNNRHSFLRRVSNCIRRHAQKTVSSWFYFLNFINHFLDLWFRCVLYLEYDNVQYLLLWSE